MLYLIPGVAVAALIDETMASVLQHIRLAGDGVMPGGMAIWQGYGGAYMKAWNSNNHQTTWGVLGAALGALREFQNEHGWGAAGFTIFGTLDTSSSGMIRPLRERLD